MSVRMQLTRFLAAITATVSLWSAAASVVPCTAAINTVLSTMHADNGQTVTVQRQCHGLAV